MSAYLYFGLLISLAGMPGVLLIARGLKVDGLSIVVRACFWGVGAVVFIIAWQFGCAWIQRLGFKAPSSGTFVWSAAACLLMFAVVGLLQLTLEKMHRISVQHKEQFGKLVRLSFTHRLFIIITAAVVEEVLYRGYAIGVGSQLTGSVLTAGLISLAAFTAAHIRWGLSHLLSVFLAGGILTILFVITNDLLACIIAHAVVDAVGFLLMPALMKPAARHPAPGDSAG